MNNHTKGFICLLLCAVLLVSCQPAPNIDNNLAVFENGVELAGEDTAYPVEESIILPQIEYAYPIDDEDLARLMRTWEVSEQWQEGTLNENITKSYSFHADGRFNLRTADETVNGQWTAQLSAIDAMLTLAYETNEIQVVEILELSETLLRLGYFKDGMLIEEVFLPAD